MKFKHLNIQNVLELVPAWAVDPFGFARTLDDMLARPDCRPLSSRISIFKKMEFWVEVDARVSPPTVRVVTADEEADFCGLVLIDGSSVAHKSTQVVLPLNPMLRKYPSIAGTYSIYAHAFRTYVPLSYIGMTKQRWFDRYSQHVSSAKTGSSLLFHEGLRKHLNTAIVHRVFFTELTHELALEQEEEFVANMGLYPLGLNMIPGGLAGFKYLGRLGVAARNAEQRNAAIEDLAARKDLNGRPNPLNAARWESDPDFVERVICGHSGRLTAEEVRHIPGLVPPVELAPRLSVRPHGASGRWTTSLQAAHTAASHEASRVAVTPLNKRSDRLADGLQRF